MSHGFSFPSFASPSLVHIPESSQDGFEERSGPGVHNRSVNEPGRGEQLTGPKVNLRGRDYARLTPEEHNVWRHGYWDHGYHNGYSGWWWVAGGLWYYYPEPIYPYPTYISDYLYPAPAIVSRQYWYYCSDPPGYYPDVISCYDAWQVLPTMPPGADPTALSEPVSPEVRTGYRVAQVACSTCHVVSPNQRLRPLVQQPGPSFMDIANRPDTSAESLEKFITNTGWNVEPRPITMPNQGLSKQATQQVVSYIMSLKS